MATSIRLPATAAVALARKTFAATTIVACRLRSRKTHCRSCWCNRRNYSTDFFKMPQKKIADLITELRKNGNEKFASFEISPKENFNVDKFKIHQGVPLFFSIVWRTPENVDMKNINEENVMEIPAIKLAVQLGSVGETVLMHITCSDMTKSALRVILDCLQKNDIKNLLVIKGDKSNPEKTNNDFNFPLDMITYIKQFYGDYFCIGIAGFPGTCQDPSSTVATRIKYLKAEVDAGGDFIITQMFFDHKDVSAFIRHCENSEIRVPIVPGICLFTSYTSLVKMTELTKVVIPQNICERIQNVKNGEFTSSMVDIYVEILRHLENCTPVIPGYHWFTLNNIEPFKLFKIKYDSLKK